MDENYQQNQQAGTMSLTQIPVILVGNKVDKK